MTKELCPLIVSDVFLTNIGVIYPSILTPIIIPLVPSPFCLLFRKIEYLRFLLNGDVKYNQVLIIIYFFLLFWKF